MPSSPQLRVRPATAAICPTSSACSRTIRLAPRASGLRSLCQQVTCKPSRRSSGTRTTNWRWLRMARTRPSRYCSSHSRPTSHTNAAGGRRLKGVRVDSASRSTGLGRELFEWAIARAEQRGCHVLQPTTDKQRQDARRFYENLGFVASHEGMKLQLTSSICSGAAPEIMETN